jgi:hypothetical protein
LQVVLQSKQTAFLFCFGLPHGHIRFVPFLLSIKHLKHLSCSVTLSARSVTPQSTQVTARQPIALWAAVQSSVIRFLATLSLPNLASAANLRSSRRSSINAARISRFQATVISIIVPFVLSWHDTPDTLT